MLKFLYNLLFPVFLLLTWPYFYRRMRRRGPVGPYLGERVARYGGEVQDRLKALNRPLWIHAVSVGEMMIARVLVKELRKILPEQAVVLTATTLTGRKVGEAVADDRTVVLYTPVDVSCVVRKAFDAIRPSMLVLIEQEIWPNYLWEAEKRGVPVWLLNGRLSDRSMARFSKWRKWTAPLLSLLDVVGIQDENSRELFIKSGFPAHAIFCTGSAKYDVALPGGVDGELPAKLRQSAGWTPDDKVFMGGSTHPGEEAVLLDIFKRLKEAFPGLKMILAPRHAERAPQVDAMVREGGWEVVRRSHLKEEGDSGLVDVLVLDTTGELKSLYAMADVTFVGKSLLGIGGQNFLEAVAAGSSVVVGPHMESFRTSSEEFVKLGGIIQVADAVELEKEIRGLLEDQDKCRDLGSKGRELFEERQGACRRMAEMVSQALVAAKR